MVQLNFYAWLTNQAPIRPNALPKIAPISTTGQPYGHKQFPSLLTCVHSISRLTFQ
jgi:hypothetical protein